MRGAHSWARVYWEGGREGRSEAGRQAGRGRTGREGERASDQVRGEMTP